MSGENDQMERTAIHELASKGFDRTPGGLIFSDDLKRLYSVLLICLDLEEKPKLVQKKLLPSLTKHYPFSFYIRDAILKMNSLSLNLNTGTTCVTVSYSIRANLACKLLQTFMDAKLLHAPADRTRRELKDKVVLQPTPKGVSILQRYVRQAGLKECPRILTSNLNSMELFTFERSSMTDAIIHSDYFVSLLFVKLMGPFPNAWSPSNAADKLPSLSKLLECSEDYFSFESSVHDEGKFSNYIADTSNSEASVRCTQTTEELRDENRQSPLAHRFFTNPDSTSHVQYYVSSTGVRLFKSKTFGDNRLLVNYCFTTKAVWQWLMDCTDILYPKEAVIIASLFLKNGLIIPVNSGSTKKCKKFLIASDSYYDLTNKGWETVKWNTENGIKSCMENFYDEDVPQTHNFEDAGAFDPSDRKSCMITSSSPLNRLTYVLNLNQILKDPGMRYLFRNHLENDFCAENLDVYIEIKKFSKKMTILKNLIDARAERKEDSQIPQKPKNCNSLLSRTVSISLSKHANECLGIAYNIFSSFITIGAPFQLNIDYSLRESITEILLRPQSSIDLSSPEDLTVTEIFQFPECDRGQISSTAIGSENSDILDDLFKSQKHISIGAINPSVAPFTDSRVPGEIMLEP